MTIADTAGHARWNHAYAVGVAMPMESEVDRPVSHRHTARVVLSDPDGRVLLFENSDPFAPGAPTFWVTPGGGVDSGESLVAAVIREVREETGFAITDSDLRGPVAERTVVHGYSDQIVVQAETFYVATAPGADVSADGWTEDEFQTVIGHRWWTVDELRATEKAVWPGGLGDLVAVAHSPDRWPVALSVAEESTIPTNHSAR